MRPGCTWFLHMQPSSLWGNTGSRAGRGEPRQPGMRLQSSHGVPTPKLMARIDLTRVTSEGGDHRLCFIKCAWNFLVLPSIQKTGMLTFVPCICIWSSQWACTAAGTHKHYQPPRGIFQGPSSAGLSARWALHSGYKCPDIEASWKPGKLWQTDRQCLGKQQWDCLL